jgi:cell division protein FtsQ
LKKKKGNDLDFYYLSKDNNRVQKKKKHPKKKTKKKNPEPINDDMFNIDNEIVIGVTVLPSKDEKNKNKNKKKKVKKKTNKEKFDVTDSKPTKSNYSKNGQAKNKKRISYEEDKKRKQKREKRFRIIKTILKLLFIFAIIIGISLFLFVSPVFNIKNIEVNGNSKINVEEIKSLSKLTLEENIFKFSAKQVKAGVKENAYIDTVEVKRKIPNTVQLNVTERKAKYQLEFGNAFAYLDGNGNILEISSENNQMPIIRGYETLQENIKSGNKIVDNDCNKLLTVQEFLKVAEDNGIQNLITIIDISNDEDYKFELPSKGKVAYMGDGKNIGGKILTLKEILTREEGKNGQIFINDSNKMPYFRENV